MSNIFLKGGLKEIFDSLASEQSSVALPSFINIVEKNGAIGDNLSSVTSELLTVQKDAISATSMTQQQKGGAGGTCSFSATSPMSQQLGGGNFSATSMTQQQKGGNATSDINQLISMLTTESSDNKSTNTDHLEGELRTMLQQGGSSFNKSSLTLSQIKGFFQQLKDDGVKVDVKLNDATLTEFLGNADATTTAINTEPQIGGKKKSAKKSSKKIKSISRGGAMAPGMLAFQKIMKHIRESKIANAVKDVAKIAKEFREKAKSELGENADPYKLADRTIELINKKYNKN